MKKSKTPREHGVVTLRMPADLSAELSRWARASVPGGHREADLHLTVKWGVLANHPDEVARAVRDVGPVHLTLGRVIVLPQPKCDVVACAVELCPALLALRGALDFLPSLADVFAFRPHVSLARGPRRAFRHLSGAKRFEGRRVYFDQLVYSDRGRHETTITLAKNDQAA